MEQYTENELREVLGKDLQISKQVNQRLEGVYDQIRQGEVKQKRKMNGWYKAAGAVAAVALVGCFFVNNPAIAAEIPLLGHIFERISNEASYPGDYSKVGTALVGTETEETETQTAENPKYVQTADGLTVTLSEVYCNKVALYLTMKLESEDPFEDCMVDMHGRPVIAVEGKAKFDFSEDEKHFLTYMDGRFEDDSTYIGLFRMDLTEYFEGEKIPDRFQVDLACAKVVGSKKDVPTIYEIAGVAPLTKEELEAMSDEEWQAHMRHMDELVPDYGDFPNKYENFWYEGSYDFQLDIQMDDRDTKVYSVDDGNGKEYYVESVTVTPFEMSVKQIGREKSITNDLVLYVLDAEGKQIDAGLSGGAEDVLSVHGHDLSKIDIYYVPWDFWENEIKGTWFETHTVNEDGKTLKQLCDENNVYHQEVELK